MTLRGKKNQNIKQVLHDLRLKSFLEIEEDSGGNFACGKEGLQRLGTSGAWGYHSNTVSSISALVKMYFLQSYSQGLHFNIQQVILMLEVQKSYFEKYRLKGKGREIRKESIMCRCQTLCQKSSTQR